MQQITINVNPSIYEHIMFFLQNLPKNLIDIESTDKNYQIYKPSKKSEVFGILKGKIEDPVQWQREVREESDRDIYGTLK